MSLEQLTSLRSEIDRAIIDFEMRKKREALAKLEELAKESGYSLSTLMAEIKPTRGKSGEAKTKRAARVSTVEFKAPRVPGKVYRNPDNHAETFTGRGRRPNWLVDQVEAGRSPEEFLVPENDA